MAATTGLLADSMAWIIGISGGPVMLDPNSLMSAPVVQNEMNFDIKSVQTESQKEQTL